MGGGASTALKTASGDQVKAVVQSLPKEDGAKLVRAMELLQGRPRGVQQMCSQHSTSRFDASRAVPKQAMTQIFEGLRSVPSSANTQPWNIVAVQGDKKAQLATKLLEKYGSASESPMEYADLPSSMIPRMQKAVSEYRQDYQVETTTSAISSAPLHVLVTAPVGPCLKEDPPVDGVFLDMGSAMTAISMCAHDLGLGVHVEFSVAKHGEVYRETLQGDFPEDHFVICGISIGWPEGGRDPRVEPLAGCSRLPVDETTRWINCDSAWFTAPPTPAVPSAHGLMHLVASRHCSHTLDPTRVVPKDLLVDVLTAARCVTSIENSQPWAVTVIQGQARDKLSQAMLDYFDAGNNGGQSYKKYSTQNTARMQKGKDQYGFELYEQRHGLQRDDAEGRRQKYRPNYEFWGAPVLLLLNLPKSSVAGTFVDVGSYMYGILLAMHAYGLGGKPLGSVAKFTELCREVLGEEAMPQDEHLVCGICIGWPKDGRDPRETADWFPSRLAMEETTRFVSNNDWA